MKDKNSLQCVAFGSFMHKQFSKCWLLPDSDPSNLRETTFRFGPQYLPALGQSTCSISCTFQEKVRGITTSKFSERGSFQFLGNAKTQMKGHKWNKKQLSFQKIRNLFVVGTSKKKRTWVLSALETGNKGFSAFSTRFHIVPGVQDPNHEKRRVKQRNARFGGTLFAGKTSDPFQKKQ